jgi:TP901 family phage tail tape measure protein
MQGGSVSIPITAGLPPFAQGLAKAQAMANQFERRATTAMKGIRTSTNGATAATGRLANGLRGANVAATGLVGTMGSLSMLLGPLTAGFAALFAVRTIADFGKSMAGVAAVTRATGEEMSRMTGLARELGATTEFTASQAAEGMRFLGMAGFQTNAILSTMPAMLDLATAATLDLGEAADITSNIMTAFGIPASESVRVADTMAAIASRANTNVQQLGYAMKFAGPVAAGLGKGIGETAAAIGVLSDTGMQATMAGTGLRTALAKLVDPVPKAEKAIRAMGLTLEDVNPATKSTVEIMEALARGGLDVEKAMVIAGLRGGPALLNLVRNVPRLKELTAAMSDTAGEAQRMATVMRDELKGDLQTAQSAIQDFFLTVGSSGATSGLRSAVQGVTAGFRTLSDNIETVSGVAAAAATLGFFKLAGAVRAVTTATWGMAAAMAATPLGLVSLGLAGIVGLLVTFKDETVDIGNTTIRVGGILEAAWTTVKEAVNILVAEMTGLANVTYRLVQADFSGAMEAGRDAALQVAAASERINTAWQSIVALPLPNFAAGMAAAAEAANRMSFGVNLPSKPAGVIEAEGGEDLGESDVEKYDKRVAAIKRQVQAMQIEAETYGMTAAAAERHRIIKELENAANEAGIALTETQIEQNARLAESAANAAGLLEGLRILDDIRTPAEQYNMEMERLNALLQQGAIGWQTYQMAARQAAENAGIAWHQTATTIIGALQAVAEASGKSNSTMSKVTKIAGIAQAIINTHVGITKALASAPPPFNFALAAAVGAQGFASVAAIRSQSESRPAVAAPSIPSRPSTTTSAGAAGGEAGGPQQTINVTLRGRSFDREQVKELMESMNELIADGARLRVTAA